MRSVTFSLSASLLASTVIALPSAFDTKSYKAQDIITRDVAVIGGGAAGTYSAISLKDKGKSVIVVEKQGRLGGHTETYYDPATGTPIDLGVSIWHNITVVTDFFKRFNIPITNSGGFFGITELIRDFRTGKEVTLTSTPTGADVGAAFAAYLTQLAKYPTLNDGIFVPSPVPEDLYMPFGKFVTKYGLQAAVPTIFNYNPGVGDVLSNPTLEVIRYWGQNMVQDLSIGFLTTAAHNSSVLYTAAEAELQSSSSVLLSSVVTDSVRSDSGIKLVVKTPKGNKLILAKKLIIAIPPKLDFLAPFDLSTQEKSIFGKWIDAGYYVGIVKNTGFPDNISLTNAAQDTAYNLPSLPGAYSFAPNPAGIPGLHMVTYASPQSAKSLPIPDATVKAEIIKTIKTLQKANPDKFTTTTGEPEFIDYRSHSPYNLQAKAEDIKDGFYQKLYALQGVRSTYWTGAAFKAEDSSGIWRFSEEKVIPALLAGKGF